MATNYRWMPAGTQPKNFLTYLWLYVRYEKNNVKRLEYKQIRSGIEKATTYIKLPDRTLCITEREPHPLNDTWDEAICTSFFDPHSIVGNLFPEVLISAHNGLMWGLKERASWLHNDIEIFGDCLTGDTFVKTSQGERTLQSLCPSKEAGWHTLEHHIQAKVLGINKSILAVYKSEPKSVWALYMEGLPTPLKGSAGHKVRTKDGFKCLRDIIPGHDYVRTSSDNTIGLWRLVEHIDIDDVNQVEMYDLHVGGLHAYVANNVLVHNSGGAQLKLDTSDFIDPYEVINWYNGVVDTGVSLDIPPRPVNQKDNALLRRLAYAQRANNQIFLKERDKRVKLLNCIHGFTLQQSRDWLNIVQEDGFEGWAAGSDSNKLLGTSFRTYMTAVLEGDPRMKKRFHFFGVSGRHTIPAVAWLSKYADRVTTDSTNWLRGLRDRGYFNILISGELKIASVGESTRLSPLTPLPCNCPICSRVGFWDVFHLPGATKVQGLLALHNLITFNRIVQMWSNWADTMTLKEYCHIMNNYFCDDDDFGARSIGRAPVVKEFRSRGQKVIEYIQCCVDEGLDTADKKFRPLLDHEPGRLPVKALFGNTEQERQFGPEKRERATAAMMGLKGSIEPILETYIEFHRDKDPNLVKKMIKGAQNAGVLSTAKK